MQTEMISLHLNSVKDGGYSLRKEFASRGSKFFPLREASILFLVRVSFLGSAIILPLSNGQIQRTTNL